MSILALQEEMKFRNLVDAGKWPEKVDKTKENVPCTTLRDA